MRKAEHPSAITAAAFALLMLIASSAKAWNGEGHQIVGWIAEERLTPKAKAAIADLLGDASLSDGEVAKPGTGSPYRGAICWFDPF